MFDVENFFDYIVFGTDGKISYWKSNATSWPKILHNKNYVNFDLNQLFDLVSFNRKILTWASENIFTFSNVRIFFFIFYNFNILFYFEIFFEALAYYYQLESAFQVDYILAEGYKSVQIKSIGGELSTRIYKFFLRWNCVKIMLMSLEWNKFCHVLGIKPKML